MVKKLTKCLNIKASNSMKDTFIVMGKNHNVKEFIISIQVKCLKKIIKNTCEILSIHSIQPKK